MNEELAKYFLKLVRVLLRPAVRLAVRQSLKVQTVIELLKAEFIEVAREELSGKGAKINISKISAICGLRRREVERLESGEIARADPSRSITARLMALWSIDQRFATRKRPHVLTFGTRESQFTQLVDAVNSDLNPAALLFDLERNGFIERTPRGIKLLQRNMIIKGDLEGGIQLLSCDLEDLSQSCSENFLESPLIPHHHLRTSYDKVRCDQLEGLQKWILQEGHSFHSKLRDRFSQIDLDVNPDPGYKGDTVSVSFSSFSRVRKNDLVKS